MDPSNKQREEETNMPENSFHTVRSVADRFEVTSRTVVGWIRAGKLDAVVIAFGRIRISEAAVQKLLRPLTPKTKIKQAARMRSAEGVFVTAGG
jgi:excisionase family DNA binding protein